MKQNCHTVRALILNHLDLQITLHLQVTLSNHFVQGCTVVEKCIKFIYSNKYKHAHYATNLPLWKRAERP